MRKQTVAIIGAAGHMGSAIARNLAKAGHRILLTGPKRDQLETLLAAITIVSPNADVEILDCSHEASWEADVIIPAVPHGLLGDVAASIKDVVTGKIVVSITHPLTATCDGLATGPAMSGAEELAVLLPHSKVVKALCTGFPSEYDALISGGKKADCFIAGNDDQAIATVSQLVRDAGYNPVAAGRLPASRTLENRMVPLILGGGSFSRDAVL